MRKGMKKEYDFSKGRRGAVLRMPPEKTRVTIRLDDDILDWFRQQVDDAGGGNYQTLIEVSQNGTSPANLCLFLGRFELSGFGEDFEDAIGEAIEEAARGIVGNIAAVHLQDVLGGR